MDKITVWLMLSVLQKFNNNYKITTCSYRHTHTDTAPGGVGTNEMWWSSSHHHQSQDQLVSCQTVDEQRKKG